MIYFAFNQPKDNLKKSNSLIYAAAEPNVETLSRAVGDHDSPRIHRPSPLAGQVYARQPHLVLKYLLDARRLVCSRPFRALPSPASGGEMARQLNSLSNKELRRSGRFFGTSFLNSDRPYRNSDWPCRNSISP